MYESYDALEEARGKADWKPFLGEDGAAYLAVGGAFVIWYGDEVRPSTARRFMPEIPAVYDYVLQYIRSLGANWTAWHHDPPAEPDAYDDVSGCPAVSVSGRGTHLLTCRGPDLGAAAMRASLEWMRAQRGSESDGTA